MTRKENQQLCRYCFRLQNYHIKYIQPSIFASPGLGRGFAGPYPSWLWARAWVHAELVTSQLQWQWHSPLRNIWSLHLTKLERGRKPKYPKKINKSRENMQSPDRKGFLIAPDWLYPYIYPSFHPPILLYRLSPKDIVKQGCAVRVGRWGSAVPCWSFSACEEWLNE